MEAENCTEIAAITTAHRFINQYVLKAAGHLGRDLALLLLSKGAKPILDEAREQNLARDEQVVWWRHRSNFGAMLVFVLFNSLW